MAARAGTIVKERAKTTVQEIRGREQRKPAETTWIPGRALVQGEISDLKKRNHIKGPKTARSVKRLVKGERVEDKDSGLTIVMVAVIFSVAETRAGAMEMDEAVNPPGTEMMRVRTRKRARSSVMARGQRIGETWRNLVVEV